MEFRNVKMLELLESKDWMYFPEDEKGAQRTTVYNNSQILSVSLTVMSFMTKTLIDIYIYIYIYICIYRHTYSWSRVLTYTQNLHICIRWGPRGIWWDAIRSEAQFALYGLSGAPVRTRFRHKIISSKTSETSIFSNCLGFGAFSTNVTTKSTAVTMESFHNFGKKSSRHWYFAFTSHFLWMTPIFDFLRTCMKKLCDCIRKHTSCVTVK